jgi:hypothetical protein
VTSHLKIVGKTHKSIGEIINNSRKVINAQDDECFCDFSLLPKIDGHVASRAIDLPDCELRRLLLYNKKTPLQFGKKAYLGIQFELIRTGLEKLSVTSWPFELNENLFKVLSFNFVQIRNRDFEYANVKRVIEPYRQFCFVELDKNANTFAIMCKKYYLQAVKDHFSDVDHYEKISSAESTVKKLIEQNLKKLQLDSIAGHKRKWKIGPARLLPKNKDIKKMRPLVSYYNFIGRPIGRKVARALMTVTKEISKEWTTFELSKTKDYWG